MALCNCIHGPRCEMFGGACDQRADWSVLMPLWLSRPLRLYAQFSCAQCWNRFKANWHKPIKGLDKPDGADDEWRPSLMEVIQHGCIAVAFEERKERERAFLTNATLSRPDDRKRYTPAQLKQVMVFRRFTQELRRPPSPSREAGK